MPDAFVTGGSGFIGGALLERLVGEGRDVVGSARSDASAAAVSGMGARPVHLDLLDVPDLARAMRGSEVVFHVAGVNEMCPSDPETMERVNVDGAAAVVRAAAEAGVRRVVLTSSAAAIGEEHDTVGRETSPHRGFYLSTYERTKRLGELAAFEEARRLGVNLVAVLPSSVQGPGRTGGSAKILIAYLRGRLRFIVDTTLSVVYVDDCIDGHIAAADHGAQGERYLLSGATLTISDAIEIMRQHGGPDVAIRSVPMGVAKAAGAVLGAFGRLTRRSVPLCPEMVRTLAHGHHYDGSKAVDELGISYTPIEEALRRTLEWYRSQGIV